MYRKGCDNTYRFRYNIRKIYQELISTVYSNVFHVTKGHGVGSNSEQGVLRPKGLNVASQSE